ncbi:amidohydrolase [Arthrobacter sp. PGP41]|uniref:amidohydrolase n=1 Tax=Arthrobacter sp. PGP41 TaxID=2079227 RepID=UPI000CDC1904|nr:amidohydrolase [Arthrobacter sp. PGP41]AUZ34605.1 amidohydrolase [Arthrobacter sp. PGP41]
MSTPAPTDILILSSSILHGEHLEETAGFIAINDGHIVAIGPTEEAEQWTPGAARVIDVGDATVTPGLIDAHIHPILGISIARGLDLNGITEFSEVRLALAEYAAQTPHRIGRDWLFAWGLDPVIFGEAEFSNDIFEGILDGELVYITLFDGHAALVSDAGLSLAGVTGREKLDSSGFIGTTADGKPNGMLYEMAAMELVQPKLPPLSFDERVNELDRLLRSMAEAGLVGGQMLDFGQADSLEVLEALEERGDLSIRLRISPWVMPGVSQEDLDRLLAMQGRHGRRWHVRGIKLMMDGTIDNGTAWLFAPDTHGESVDPLWPEPEGLSAAMRFFHDNSVPTATHAIGDRAVSHVARTVASLPPNGTIHRIEHIESIPDEVLNQVVESGATTSLQPTHCTLYSRADHTDNWSRRLGTERANHAWRTRDLREAGAVVALGSDWPIAPFDPRGVIAAAQTRRPAGRPDITPVQPQQALSARAALEGYTSQYWQSVGEEGGILRPGGRADLTVFAQNPLNATPDEFAAAPVILTMVDGDVVADKTARIDAPTLT